jgi:hypothetical protein
LIVATPLSLFSPSATGPRLTTPRSGLERSDFVLRRIAAVADRDRERRKWAGKQALPSDTYRMMLIGSLPI